MSDTIDRDQYLVKTQQTLAPRHPTASDETSPTAISDRYMIPR